jgi:diamine N-acetyltransferase
MNLIIKEAKDITTIVKLNKFVHDLHHKNNPTIFEKYNYTTFLKSLGAYIRQDEIKCFTAYDSDKPIGYLLFCIRNYPENFFKKGHRSFFIDQMAVRPEHRGKGIGRQLIDRAILYCRKNKIKRIELSVWGDNASAKRFYEKLGFDVYLENMKKEFPRSRKSRKVPPLHFPGSKH